MTLDDLKQFYKQHYTQSNLILGLAGGYPPEFLERDEEGFRGAAGEGLRRRDRDSRRRADRRTPALSIVEKNTRSVAYSFGFPIDVKRGDPDYPALLVMQSYFGPASHERRPAVPAHSRGSRHQLRRLRLHRVFPARHVQLMEPPPNLARRSQIFQIWIRPVEPPPAAFALRLAVYELDKLVKDGHPAGGFRTHQRVPDQVRQRADEDQARRTRLRDRQPVLRHSRLQQLHQERDWRS